MSMGRKRERQEVLFVEVESLVRPEGQVFYARLNELLERHGFDAFVEGVVDRTAVFADVMGRPSIAPGVYFRMMMVGYFEGIRSERGIAWRCADSLGIREFLGYELTERTPDHSTLSGLRRRLPEGVHREVFDWVLGVARSEGVLRGRTVAVDSTTLEANASMKKIVHRVDGVSYEKYVRKLASEDKGEEASRSDARRMDRKRKGRTTSNKDWASPADPEARIARMKDGTTKLAYKAEHAVDIESTLVVAAEIHQADQGDTQTISKTVDEAEATVRRAGIDDGLKEVIADCGYQSDEVLVDLQDKGLRTYVAERTGAPQRNWKSVASRVGDDEMNRRRAATRMNRKRGRRPKGRRHQKARAIVERSFAHSCRTGALRHVTVRGTGNVQKRYLGHLAGLNLGVLMRALSGTGTPRSLQGRLTALLSALLVAIMTFTRRASASFRRQRAPLRQRLKSASCGHVAPPHWPNPRFSTAS
jgi:transposase